MAVELINKSHGQNHKIKAIIADEDSSTMAKVKQLVPHHVEKYSDLNHSKKIVSNSFYRLKTVFRILTSKVIKYITHCFSAAVHKNKNNPVVLKAAILNIVSHIYGEHANCNSAWCRHKETSSRPFTRLPHGKPLADSDLRQELEAIFQKQQKILKH